MRAFIVACAVAVIFAVGGAAILANFVQEPSSAAFAEPGVRIERPGPRFWQLLGRLILEALCVIIQYLVSTKGPHILDILRSRSDGSHSRSYGNRCSGLWPAVRPAYLWVHDLVRAR
jgi:hypothetical protein